MEGFSEHFTPPSDGRCGRVRGAAGVRPRGLGAGQGQAGDRHVARAARARSRTRTPPRRSARSPTRTSSRAWRASTATARSSRAWPRAGRSRADGKEYIFKLRSGVKFHDGEALDASVVKFAIDRLFAADSTVPAKSLYTDISTGRGGRSGDGEDHAEDAQLLPALQHRAVRRGDPASQERRRPTTSIRSAPAPSCSRSARKAIRSRW